MRIAFYIFLFLSVISCNNNTETNLIDNGAEFTVLGNETFDFGTITEGESVDVEFMIKNTGEGNLIITNAKASCGCTELNFPKQEIEVGEEEIIDVTFNSKGKNGTQSKKITLTTNATPNIKILTITGTVVPKTK